jgi:hypothetical protein
MDMLVLTQVLRRSKVPAKQPEVARNRKHLTLEVPVFKINPL